MQIVRSKTSERRKSASSSLAMGIFISLALDQFSARGILARLGERVIHRFSSLYTDRGLVPLVSTCT